jgi:hypothetical protein
MHTGFWWESQKESDHYEHLGGGSKIILKQILKKVEGGSGLIWLRILTSGGLFGTW